MFRRPTRKQLALAAIAGCIALPNVLAYRHALRMTHLVGPAEERTGSPESLSAVTKLRTLMMGVRIPRPSLGATPAAHGRTFRTERFPARDGVELEAWHCPIEDPRGIVVLFHGYAAAKDSLLEESAAYLDLGFETLLVDFRGSGGSTGEVTSLGWFEALDVAAAWAHARRLSDGPVILHGTSLGAAAVLRAIHVERVKPDAVVLEAPFGRLLTTTERRFERMGLPPFPAARLLVFWGGVLLGFDGFAHDPQTYVKSVACPALVLFGEEDPNIRPDDARELMAYAPTCVESTELAGVTHAPFLRADQAAWRKAVEALLVRLR